MALAADEQAVATVVFGPRRPKWIEMLPAAALAIIFGMTNGLTRPGPLVDERRVLLLELGSPPMPLPRMHAAAERVFLGEVEAAVLDGLGGGDHGELGEAVEPAGRPGRRGTGSGSKSLTSPPNLTLKAVVSNCVIGRDAALAGEQALPVVRHVAGRAG